MDSIGDGTPSALRWPAEGISRVPYRAYADEDIYRLEQERLFKGAIWQFLGLEVEIPKIGDFKTTWLGDTPVVLVRSEAEGFAAFVNKCAHRGSTLCFEPCGHRERFTCVYHNWTYDLHGKLKSVAFHKGVGGAGGLPDDFDMARHNLVALRVESFCGLIFGSFSAEVPPVEQYLGEKMAHNIRRIFSRPVKILATYSQLLHNNWKLYIENVKDSYHASLLHLFITTFRLNRLSMQGGLLLDESGGHHISFTKMQSAEVTGTDYEAGTLRAQKDDFGLRDKRLLQNWMEFEDGITHTIQTIFPNTVVHQIMNSFAVRLAIPRGVGECELFWILFGYADDTPEQAEIRDRLSNLVGPAGLISMEDGVVGSLVQRNSSSDSADTAVLEMGGRGVESQDSRVSEAAVRGFWQCYRRHLGA